MMGRKRSLAVVAGFLSLIKKLKDIVVPYLKKSDKNFLLVLGGLTLFPLLIVAAIFWWSFGLLPVDTTNTKVVTLVINKGEGIGDISAKLAEQKLIRSPLHFQIYVFLSKMAHKVQAGRFRLSPAMTLPEISLLLTKGQNDVVITVIEGLRAEQIGDLLVEKGFPINQAKWQAEVKAEGLEGRLFPDTYFFPANGDQKTLLQLMKNNFEKKVLGSLSLEIKKSGLSLNQILALAAIVERESRTEADRRLVAGILLKRWQKGWPLQADATVQYAVADTGCKTATECDWWPKKLTQSDLATASPYNTYRNKGLPPGPICNPGLAAIKAVLTPQESSYWYYLSDAEGKIHYAQTEPEQTANINLYLR